MAAGQYHRFAQDTPDSRQAWLWVASILALIYSFLVMMFRLVGKWRAFNVSDVLLFAAYFLSLMAHVCVYVGLHYGLGKYYTLVSESDLRKISNLVFITKLLTFPALGLAKASILVFARTLFSAEAKRARLVLRYAIIFVTAWSLLCTLLLGTGCSPYKILIAHSQTCPGQWPRIYLAGGIEGLTEVLVVVLPVHLTIKRDLKREVKTILCLGFGMRILILPIAIAYLVSFSWQDRPDARSGMSIVPTLILQETLLCWSLILATTSTLRNIAGRFNSGGVRNILARSRDPKQSELGLTRTAAVHAIKSMAAQIRGIGAYSIFDMNRRHGHEVPHVTGVRMDIDNRHWANVFIRPEDEKLAKKEDGDPFSLWGMQMNDYEDWERRRAEQIINMPHRPSLADIRFVTTTDDFDSEKAAMREDVEKGSL